MHLFVFNSSLVLVLAIGVLLASGLKHVVADELDNEVARIFKSKCTMCHDDLGEDAAAGDVGFLLQFEKLTEDHIYIDIESPENSYLLEIVPDSMPKEKMRDIQWNGALTNKELDSFQRWIARGGPSQAYLAALAGSSRSLITRDAMVEAIASDLRRRQGNDLLHCRYLTITNLHNLDDINAEQLDLYRAAIVKTLNSLSWQAEKIVPEAIDEHETIYRIDLREMGWSPKQWDTIAQHYPYAMKIRGANAATINQSTASSLPFLRADWFTFVTTQPPLYHQLLDIPDDLAKLEQRLLGGADVRIQNIRNGNAVRAGFGDSGVSVNNRMVERHPSNSGGYWISYDFGSNTGKANLFEFPLGPKGTWQDPKLSQFEFDHDGGEVIFNLPNGFQAYGLYDAGGGRIDVGPTHIVHDDTMTGGAIINGVSCISCHDRGMKPENRRQLVGLDRIRAATASNLRRFDEDTRLQIQELYPEGKKIADLMRKDRTRFLESLENAGISLTKDEPVRAMFNQFVADLSLDSVAAELGVEPELLTQKLGGDSETRVMLIRLLDEGMKRQLFVQSYRQIVELCGFGTMIPAKPLIVPFFGDAEPVNVVGEPKKLDHPLTGTGVDLIDQDHQNGELQIQLSTLNEQHHFRDGDELKIELMANKDCFVSVLSVDSTGVLTLLVPNQWHPQGLPVKANKKAVFPTPAMGFSFFAQPPHGKTLIKAIATAKPLAIAGAEPTRFEQEPLISFGNTKDLRTTLNSTKPQNHSNATERFDLTRHSPDTFLPLKSWASARWTVVTHPK